MFSRVCHHCARLTRPWVPVPVISHPILTSDSVAAFFTCYGVGMVLLTLLRFFLDKLIIPGNRSVDIEISEDQNWWVWRGAARPHFVASSVLLLLCTGVWLPSKPLLYSQLRLLWALWCLISSATTLRDDASVQNENQFVELATVAPSTVSWVPSDRA